jgi:hypothetical protein
LSKCRSPKIDIARRDHNKLTAIFPDRRWVQTVLDVDKLDRRILATLSRTLLLKNLLEDVL